NNPKPPFRSTNERGRIPLHHHSPTVPHAWHAATLASCKSSGVVSQILSFVIDLSAPPTSERRTFRNAHSTAAARYGAGICSMPPLFCPFVAYFSTSRSASATPSIVRTFSTRTPPSLWLAAIPAFCSTYRHAARRTDCWIYSP